MRATKREYYLNIAKAVAQRSTCLRRQYGAVIVKDDVIMRPATTARRAGTRTAATSASAGARRTAFRTGSSTKNASPSMPRPTRSSAPTGRI